MSGTVEFITYTYDPNHSGALNGSATYARGDLCLLLASNTSADRHSASRISHSTFSVARDDEKRMIGVANPDGTLDTHTYAADNFITSLNW